MQQKLSKIIAALMPTGLLGVSVALAPPADAAPRPLPPSSTPATAQADVAARLSAIRAAVTTAMPAAAADAEPGVWKVWWGNHGWGRPWRGWGWGNGGWGWHNGGWGNWHPWGNGGWGNWHPWGNY